MKILSLAAASLSVLLLSLMAIAGPSNRFPTAANESETSAAQLFSRNCVRCHGKDGQAKGLKAKLSGARNLTTAEWQDRVTDERIFNSINNGKGKMPAYGKKLSEAEVNSLVNYVRGLKK